MITSRPISPFLVLQEIYHPDVWKVMVCCIFLNQTGRVQVDKIRHQFFDRWPNPESVKETDFEEMRDMLKPLGFYNRRSKTIIRFSHEYLNTDWDDIRQLHGIGQYARDSYAIFFEGVMVENPADHVLKDYVKWYNQSTVGSFADVWGYEPNQYTNVHRTNGLWGNPAVDKMLE
jgi:methyl-CpG-binding domain protein 4